MADGAASASEAEVAALAAAVQEQGGRVRELKTSGASKEDVEAAVAKLLQLKEQHAKATGQPLPSGGGGSKKGKKKDKKDAGAGAGAAAGGSGKKKEKKDKEPAKEGKKKGGAKGGDKKAKSDSKAGAAAAATDADADMIGEAVQGAERFSFPETEREILKYWEEIDAFQTSLKLAKGRPEFTFYDGPPFATGMPHYGHILAGTIKDVVTRYAQQTGHYVERRFGWDCHGLPVEYEIDKKLNITGPHQVREMGIDKYNLECRSIVSRYSGEWRQIMTRLGRWIDFDNDYKTMYPWFMESVWNVFKQLFEKGLVYRGFKVMPFSTALATPLSNFEANQEMKDVVDPAVVAAFKAVGEENVFYLAWTTTPWTLPSNLALCVHPEFEYCRFHDKKRGQTFVALKSLVLGSKGALYKEKDAANVEILETFPGASLEGKKYEPLFGFFDTPARRERAWRVVCDTYVTADSGTGIVHNAPGHGEDDYRVCLREGIISNEDIPCPVDDSGKYTSEVAPWEGVYVKDADKLICKDLRGRNQLFSESTVKHAYAFCWRSDTPLIRKTIDSWFVRVEDLKDRLLANSAETNWVPPNIKEGRFHNWLADARDWAISRNRFWGTPIPLWVSEDMEEVVCVGSIAELEQLSGVTGIDDLHRESIDHITIPSKQGKGDLRRVDQVFDCWFESGSMPYAQKHYPFENKERFESTFPADFIAEGVDQTRGWFYTMLVIGTALFDKAPWKNLIVNGLVLASDGKKMSKRLKNYPDPQLVIDNEGSDALRLYLINSPVVRADNLKFKRAGVQSLVREVFLPWLNAYRFFEQSNERYEIDHGAKIRFRDTDICPSQNPMDTWILAYTQSLVAYVHEEMQGYRLYTVVPRLVRFVDSLTNWYIRFNRKRLKGFLGQEEAKLALWTLGEVLVTMTKTMAPFTPFFAEYIYQKMRPYVVDDGASTGGAYTWTTADVASWLASKGLGQYKALFQKHGIKGEDLLDLSHEDLQSMGVERCTDRKAILRPARELAGEQTFEQTPAAAAPGPDRDMVQKSVHFQLVPQPKAGYANPEIERAFEVLKRVILAGRLMRDQSCWPVKYPLPEIVVVSKTPFVGEDLKWLEHFVLDELNVEKLTFSSNEAEYNVVLQAVPNFAVVGPRLGPEFKATDKAVRALTHEQLTAYQANPTIEVNGHTLSGDDLVLSYKFTEEGGKYATQTDTNLLILLDVHPTKKMVEYGVAREVISTLQRLRKAGDLVQSDRADVYYTVTKSTPETPLEEVIVNHTEEITAKMDGKPTLFKGAPPAGAAVIVDGELAVRGAEVKLVLVRAE